MLQETSTFRATIAEHPLQGMGGAKSGLTKKKTVKQNTVGNPARNLIKSKFSKLSQTARFESEPREEATYRLELTEGHLRRAEKAFQMLEVRDYFFAYEVYCLSHLRSDW